jgi:hypothetical protein
MRHAYLLWLAACATPSTARDSDADLRVATQALLDAFAPGDRAVWDRLTDQGLVYVTEDNEVEDKAKFLANLQPLPPGMTGTIAIEAFHTQPLDSALTATTYMLFETESVYGQTIHTRFRESDIWRHTSAGPRLVHAQIFAVLHDPPAGTLTTEQLDAYAGTYVKSTFAKVQVRRDGDHLVAERQGRPPLILVPEVADVFFTPGRPRTRRVFFRDGSGAITGYADRREGEDVTWTKERS